MIERWWTRLWLRDDWIREAAEDAFLAFAREMDGPPATPTRTETSDAEDPCDSAAITVLDPERTPSLA